MHPHLHIYIYTHTHTSTYIFKISKQNRNYCISFKYVLIYKLLILLVIY